MSLVTRSPEERDLAAEERDHLADRRDLTSDQRDQVGDERDKAADLRDRAADQRDFTADQRDGAADARDLAAEDNEKSSGLAAHVVARLSSTRQETASDRSRASDDRRAGADERRHAQRDRHSARVDREAGVSERVMARLDRRSAQADRGVSAVERRSASTDGLTGVLQRGAGLIVLRGDIGWARSENQPLSVAFADVDGLKAVNDTLGHEAGDRLLVDVVRVLRRHVRANDLIMRYGGDEFVCALPGLRAREARERLARVNAALANSPEHGSVTIGVAELRPDDLTEDLIARADAELYLARQKHRRART